MNRVKKIIAIMLIVVMMMQMSHLENYRYIGEVFATGVDTETPQEDSIQERTENVTTEEATTQDGESVEQTNTQQATTEEIQSEEVETLETITSSTTNIPTLEVETIYNYNSTFPWVEFVAPEEGVIEGDYEWSDCYKLTSDLTIKGNLDIKAPLNLNGYSLTVEGDVVQCFATIINGNLSVYGNYGWQAGNMILDEGYMYVGGDLSVRSACADTVYMQNPEDYMLVSGDMFLNVNNEITTHIVDGIIDLKGDFIQEVTFENYAKKYSKGNFLMEEESVLLLSGDGGQNIFVSNEDSGFSRVVVSTEGLTKDENDQYLFGDRHIGFSGLCNYETYEDNGCPSSYGYMTYKQFPAEGNYIYGSVYYDGEDFTLNRYVTIVGNYIQNAGMTMKSAGLYVTDDYRIQAIDGEGGFSETEGFLDTTGGARLYLYGDFYTQSVVDHTDLLKSGTWNINGNVYQIGTDAKNFTLGDSTNYISIESHSDTKEIHFVMDNPLENTFNWISGNQNIKMYFDNGIYAKQGYSRSYFGFMYFSENNYSYAGDVKIQEGVTKVTALSATGDIIVQSDVEIATYVSAGGDFVVENGTVTISSGGIYAQNVEFSENSDSALHLTGSGVSVNCEDFNYESKQPLTMEGVDCRIYCDNFYYASNSSSGKLMNGRISFTGDFYVKDVGTADSFVSSGNHQLYASGSDRLQNITVENPASCIETLQVYNGSNAITRKTEETVIHNIINDSHSYVWEGIEGYTLEQDMVYDEDLVLYWGTLDLNGHTLTVNGDFIVERGVVDINGGHLVVNGDMNLAYRDWSDEEPQWYTSTADIMMDGEQDRIDITGDWYANFYNHSLANMTNGVVALGGNMNIGGAVSSSSYNKVIETIMSGTSLHLTGTEKQTLTGVSAQIQLHPRDFIVENENEIAVNLPLYVSGEMLLPKKLDYSFYSMCLDDLGQLTNHTFTGDLTVGQSGLTGDTRITGALYIEGQTDIRGYDLTASKISVKAPTTLSKGKIKTETLYMYEKIYMQYAEDVVETDYMYVDVATSDTDYMTDGNIYITEVFSDSTSSSYAFQPSGEHTVTFTKTDSTEELPVKIRFANSTSILNRVVLCNLLNCYSLDREKEAIANEVILGYEDTEKPAAPENLTASEVGCFSVKLSFDEATDDVEVYRYKIYRNGEYITRIKGTEYVDVVLKPNTTYRYTVSVLDAAGNESDQSPVLEVTTAQDVKAPTYVQDVEVKVRRDTVTIDCGDSFSDADTYVDYYIITKDDEEVASVLENAYVKYRNISGTTTKKLVRSGDPVFKDTDLEYGVSYKYGITAVDYAGNVSTEQYVYVMADLPPKAPTGFSVKSESGYNIISFDKSGTRDVKNYYVYRNDERINIIYNSSAEVATFIDKDVVVGETYQYYVKADNTYGTIGSSTEIMEVTTVAELTPPVIQSMAYSILSDYVNESLEVVVKATDENALGGFYAYIVKKGESEKQEIFREERKDLPKKASAGFTFRIDGLEGEYDLHIVVVDHCGNESEMVKNCKINMGGLPAVEMTDTKASASVVYLEWEPVEGAAFYSVERKVGSSYIKLYKTSDTYIRDERLNCDTSYTYRVVAYDEDEVRGLSMDDVTVTTSSDTTNPTLVKVLGDDSVLGMNSGLSVQYKDDVRVETIYIYCRSQGTGEWNLLHESVVNAYSGIAYFPWDKTGFLSGLYEVRYILEDSSGNQSDEVIKTYSLDLDGPSIQNFQVTPKDWTLQVDWENFADEDYERFELKRISATQYDTCVAEGKSTTSYEVMVLKGTTACTFSEQIAPDEEYVYMLYAYDSNGNVSVASSRGRSIDNDIFAPVVGEMQGLYAAKGYAVSLMARGCSDNDKIVSYEWDMGNGDVVSGENCEYIYNEIGTYNMKLTVTDDNGNHSTSETTVTVGEDVGILKVKVVSGSKLLSGADVVACVNGEPCHSGTASQTDSQGMMVFPIGAGTYKIAAYKSGYLPKETEVSIRTGETKEITIDLNAESIVTADFSVKQLSIKEMEEAGIDTSANKVACTYEMEFTYQSGQIEKISFGSWLGNTYHTKISGCFSTPGYGETEEEEDKEIDVSISNVSGDPVNPVFIITKTKEISIDWLQNIYQVDVTISNNASSEFTLENTDATLELPDGLALAEMKKKQQPEKWEIGALQSGESVDHTWYVGGQKSGYYTLAVQLEAILQPYNIEINEKLTSANKLKVTVGEGLHLYIYPEKEAYIGEQYYVQFKLANESEETYHNVTASFGKFESIEASAQVIMVNSEDGSQIAPPITVNTGVHYFVEDETSDSKTLMVDDRLTIKKLKPGKSMYGTWRFQFDAAGNINTDYYRLLTDYAEYLNVSSTNVKVTIVPVASHMSKKVIAVKVPKKTETANNNGGGTGGNNGGGNNGGATGGGATGENSTSSSSPTTQNSIQTVKDPINLMTGAFTTNHVVAAVAGATDLQFALSYNSLYTDAAGELGKGWSHNYEMRLERMGSLIALYQNPNQVLYFTESEETVNHVCGTVEDGAIALSDDSVIERTYYQAGESSKQYRIEKDAKGYILYLGNEKYTFTPEGVLSGYVSETGQKQEISKSKQNLVIKDVATEKTIKATYNEEGRIVSVQDTAGNETTFQYENDCMTVLTGKKGTQLIYEYDSKGRIVIGKEGDGTVYVENTFDEAGRVLSQVANGRIKEKTTFSYEENAEDETTTVTMTNADGTTEQAVADQYGQGLRYVDAIGGVKEYTYNAFSDMTSYHYGDGTGATYSYDENGNITKVVETTGKTTEYVYDSNNRVTRVVCNDGTNITYTYNENGQIASLSSGNGLSAEYTYNENGQVLTETSSLGTMEYTYEKGMLRCLKDYSDNNHYFTYDANGNVVQYIDGAGVVTDYKIDVSGRVEEETVNLEDGTKSTTKYTYDAYGNMTSKTDAKGNTTQYVYNEEDLLEKEIRPDGTAYVYSYDQNGNITKIVCPDGVTMAESVYDAAGNALSLTDTLGNLQKAGYSAGGQLLNLTQANDGEVKFTYYDNGLLESQTDANGNKTTLSYDEAGRISNVTDGSGAMTTFGYDKDGNLSSVENALGNQLEMSYNQYRKVISQTDANGNVTKYSYDKAMNCTKVTDAEGGITEFGYDAKGQITFMTKKGDIEEQDVTLSMTYDNLGNVTSLTDGEGNTQRMEYDVNSNLVAVYDAYGVKTESYEYDCLGNCITVTDAFGNVTTNSYDALGNLVKQMNESTGNAVTYSYVGGKYLASSSDSLDRTASMTYDSMGNVETLTNPNGGVTSYKYDLNNNLTDEIIGEDYHVRYTYNAQNLVATKTNSRNQQTTYSYDALGRIVKQEDEAGIIGYTYDSNDNVLTVTETIGEQVNVITRTYDGLNRVTSYEDAKDNRIEYSYDKIGNLTKLTYPNGKEVTYTYNKNCSISSVTDWNGRVTTYGYDKNGRLIETKRPNGTVEKREYDKAGQLTLILDMSGDKVVNRQEYSYDASGNITTVKQLYNGEANFTEVTTAEMTYDKNNRLLTYNGENVQYDKDGNMVYGPLNGVMTEFVFDCRNRLIQAGDTSYEYDAENNRTAVTTRTKRTEYVINSQPELSQVLQSKIIENNNEESAEITYYYYGQGLLAQENGQDYLTYHFNNVGSTMAVTDQNGALIAKYNYSPYGELIEGEYDENIQFLYNGQYGVVTDGNGLYYMRARYYNVDIKRFINQDVLTGTLERISSLNRFSYVEGNPVSYLDPFGLDVWETAVLHDITAVLGIIGGLISHVCPTIGLVVSTVAGGFDIGLCIYDAVCHGSRGDSKALTQDMIEIIFNLIGILTAGTTYLGKYIDEGFDIVLKGEGLMSGYEHMITMLYDRWKSAIDSGRAAGSILDLKDFVDFLKRGGSLKGMDNTVTPGGDLG